MAGRKSEVSLPRGGSTAAGPRRSERLERGALEGALLLGLLVSGSPLPLALIWSGVGESPLCEPIGLPEPGTVREGLLEELASARSLGAAMARAGRAVPRAPAVQEAPGLKPRAPGRGSRPPGGVAWPLVTQEGTAS